MLVRKFWIVFNQLRGHREVERDALLHLGLQRLQLVACRRVQVVDPNVVGDDRVVVLTAHGTERVLETLLLSEFAILSTTITATPATGATAPARVVLAAIIAAAAEGRPVASLAAVIPVPAERTTLASVTVAPVGRTVATLAPVITVAAVRRPVATLAPSRSPR